MRETLKKYPFFRKIRSFLPESVSLNYKTYVRFRNFIKTSENYSPEESKEFQFNQIKSLIHYCWNHIVGYRTHWEKGNFHPDKFKNLDDIRLIPIISKEIMKKDILNFTNTNLKKTIYHQSGGTTGSPFGFYEEKKVAMIEKSFMHDLWSRFYPKMNLKTKATILRGRKIPDRIYYNPMNGLLLSTFNITPENVKLYIRAIEKYKTPILHAYPSSLYFVCRIMNKYNMKLNHKFESVMLGSEKLHDFQREFITEIIDAPVCHWYGQAEKLVLAGNNINDDLFHIYPQYGFAEVLTQTGERANPGERGEIIGTGFWNLATPFIRYRTMDWVETGDIEKNKYHPSYPVLNKIEGRMQDIIIGKSKNPLSLVNVANICAHYPEIDQFQFIQQKIGELQLIYKKFKQDSFIDEEKIHNELQSYLGKEFDIHLSEVKDIQTTDSGKFIYLKQELDIEQFL